MKEREEDEGMKSRQRWMEGRRKEGMMEGTNEGREGILD